MKIKAIQFCYAVIQGHQTLAAQLLAETNLVEVDEIGVSPASFCLWASQQTVAAATEQLQKLYPFALPLIATKEPTSNTAAICASLIIPEIKEKFMLFADNIARHNKTLEVATNDKYAFFYECASASLMRMCTEDLSSEQLAKLQRVSLQFQLNTLKISATGRYLQSPFSSEDGFEEFNLGLTTIHEEEESEDLIQKPERAASSITPGYQSLQQSGKTTGKRIIYTSTPLPHPEEPSEKKEKVTP